MNTNWTAKLAGFALAAILVLGIHTMAAAQGRGGGGGGRGGGGGIGNSGRGSGGGGGVDHGIGTSSENSRGRSDEGRGTASERSRERSDAALERARAARDNRRRAEEELREHPGIARHLSTPPGRLRDEYQAALTTNPDLKFGQFVAATVLGRNLGARNSAVTRDAILDGLAHDQSIGRTLRDLGVGEREAKEAERQAEREIKQSKKRSS